MARRRTRGRSTGRGGAPRYLSVSTLAQLGPVSDEIEASFLSWCASAAQEVLEELWEEDVAALCGERWKPKPGAQVARAGACFSEIVLGGERIRVRRPRVRSRDGREIELPSFRYAAERDPIDRHALEHIAFTISTGIPPREPAPEHPIARRFLEQSSQRLRGSFHRSPGEYLPGLIVGGLTFREHSLIVAVGIARDGARRILGVRAGSRENRDAVAALLSEVFAPQPVANRPEMVMLGEDPVIRDAVREILGPRAILYRCPTSKRRRVIGALPAEVQARVHEALHAAYAADHEADARQMLETLVRQLEPEYPIAAAALRDGMEETLSLHRLRSGAGGPGRRTTPAPAVRLPPFRSPES